MWMQQLQLKHLSDLNPFRSEAEQDSPQKKEIIAPFILKRSILESENLNKNQVFWNESKLD